MVSAPVCSKFSPRGLEDHFMIPGLAADSRSYPARLQGQCPAEVSKFRLPSFRVIFCQVPANSL